MSFPLLSNIIRFFLLLALLLPGIWTAPVRAQDEVTLESVQIAIWPEYDQPSVLVIYHISLSPQTSLPAALSVRIPAAAGKPHAVAMQDSAGLFDLDYDIEAAGEWIRINFTAPVLNVRVEYYDPQIDLTSPNRRFVYRWPGDYTVENLVLQVQQPPTASNMAFKPAFGSGQTGEGGLTYFNYLVGPVDAGTGFDLTVSYRKADDRLTITDQFETVKPQEPIDASTGGQVRFDQVVPWALGALSLVMILTGAIWYWRTGRSPQPAQARARHARKTAPPEEDGGSVFCNQCGKRAGSGDLFCRACGTKLR